MALAVLMTLHVAGILLWVGGLCAAAAAMILRAETGPGDGSLDRLAHAFLFKACHPGMLLAILSGMAMTALNSGYFLREGWLYAKLALVACLILLTVLLTADRRKLSEGKISAGGLALQLKLAVSTAVFILLLVFLKPF